MRTMNDLATVHKLTMSSLEIAKLCEKRHDNVLRDIDSMIKELGGALNFEGGYPDAQGQERRCYHLPKDLTYTLVAGYSVVLRKRIVDRWLELETRDTDLMTVMVSALDRLSGLSVSQDARFVRVETKVDQVAADVIDIKTRLPRVRVRGKESDRKELIAFSRTIGGNCPIDGITPMFDGDGSFIGEIDHFDGNRGNGKISNLWPLSKENHKRKTNGEFERKEMESHFDAFRAKHARSKPKQSKLF